MLPPSSSSSPSSSPPPRLFPWLAARVPAHGAISFLIAVLGTAGVYALTRAYGSFLELAPGRRARLAALVLAGTALAAHAANRLVLPRIYPWFHAALAVVTFVLLV